MTRSQRKSKHSKTSKQTTSSKAKRAKPKHAKATQAKKRVAASKGAKAVSKAKQKGPHRVYTDASNWGVGLVINNQWQHWKWPKNFATKKKQPSIQHKEALAVEAGLRVALKNTEKLPINIFCDNNSVVGAWKKGSAKEASLHKCIIRIKRLAANSGRKLKLQHIPGKQNPADKPSRGKRGAGRQGANWHKAVAPHLHLKA